jgi:hypothetical protein
LKDDRGTNRKRNLIGSNHNDRIWRGKVVCLLEMTCLVMEE